MKILITGAQFANKGAQSMLFATVDQLRRRYSDDVAIYYLPLDNYRTYEQEKYLFHIVYGAWDAFAYEDQPAKRPYLYLRSGLRHLLKKDPVTFFNVKELHQLLPELDAIIDISGYQLTSKFSLEKNKKFLHYTELAKKYSSKMIYMPQSFGPFNYGTDTEAMCSYIKNTLSQADMIFAREEQGYHLLRDDLGLTNVFSSTDILLQTPDVDPARIYQKVPVQEYPTLTTHRNVGIIPNNETLRHGDEQAILSIYRAVLQRLVDQHKNVYIFRHSNDLGTCQKIYAMFKDTRNVHLIENDFSCFEYSAFVKQFDYIIASRFHSIVHGYREGVPALILGWAEKYRELARKVGQEQYIFDITRSDSTSYIPSILSQLDYLNDHYLQDQKQILGRIAELQKNNCFEKCWTIMEK